MQKNSRTRRSYPAKNTQQTQGIPTKYRLLILLTLAATVGVTIFAAKSDSVNQKVNGISVHQANSSEISATTYRQISPSENATPVEEPLNSLVQLNDPLLVLVNHDNILPEDYEVIPQLIDNVTVDIKIYQPINDLINAAGEEGLVLWIASGYRSVAEQTSVLERAVTQRMSDGMNDDEAREDAFKTISVPGYSEHHTGLAIDFNTVNREFADTDEYLWLQQHAEDYGFIQRYCSEKESITKIDEEVWHYRYVGIEHAKKMNELDMCLEEYLAYLNDNLG
ncbi:M15 family metallopeptidase [Scatolibacter rhodanostii]|uniref:M15 family metallopeptidase n=1 Tax=Scatolibacter rhodanostii TaxID=2014781 RepID=UPI0013567308|nr:M15 family metallopeptidase [Scatolibacter rhodanostii]